MIPFTLNGHPVTTDADERSAQASLLDALRALGATSVKDGCAPQGQCGCCTVWIDGQPRVACVTPLGRVAGRHVTTLEGLPDSARWAASFTRAGASQCGFCTPGIIMRLAALDPAQRTAAQIERSLLAHQCRCTGWQTIVEAALDLDRPGDGDPVDRDWEAAARRAELEGGCAQRVGPDVALGRCGFVADTLDVGGPACAVTRPAGETWIVAEDAIAARAEARVAPGRRSTSGLRWPVEVPPGEWAHTLQTTWVDPAALELDAARRDGAGEVIAGPGNGGGFGPKASALLADAARAAPVTGAVLATVGREWTTLHSAKRPPLAIGVDADGNGVVHVARTPGIVAAIATVAPGWTVVEVDVAGPPTSAEVRGAGWAEVAAVRAALGAGPLDDRDAWVEVRAPGRGWARARLGDRLEVELDGGPVLDATVMRSYAIGAAVMALGLVRSEAIGVDVDGVVGDLTMRSFGLLRAGDVPPIEVTIHDRDGGEPVNASDAVFAAVAGAAWRAAGLPLRWPTMRT